MQENKSIYGLVGNPIKHSLSPLMHNTAFDELGVDAVYKIFQLEEDELDGFFASLKDKDSPIFGLNVTVPYKEKAIKYMDVVSPLAAKINAINTVVISKDRKLTGFNTDAPGFLTHLTQEGFETSDKRVAILGAGGASRAIVSVLCLIIERPASIKIYDIDSFKAENLIEDLGSRIDCSMVEAVHSIDDLNIELCDLLINATPLGVKESDPLLVDPEMLHEDMLVYDLVYNPAETALIKEAMSAGAKVASGLGMLYFQGVLAFQHWANTELDEVVKNKMFESLKQGL